MKAALANFQTLPLKDAARQLLAKLGYKSDKFIAGAGSSPQAFLDLFNSGHAFDPAKALVPEWKSADLIFQIELKGGDYARGKFSTIARQINRLFPMPVMVFFRHQNRLTIAVINRRTNKLDETKDVLGKVTLISGINLAQPHRSHLDILASLALTELKHPQKKPITDFDTLHAAWEQIFNVELLNERFYRELADWYFWALPQVEFPADIEADDEKRRATSLIRLITRLIFCWFLKEKDGLIPEKLFHPTDLAKILKGFDPESETSSTYYHAILQNLFFATLNQRMGKDGNGQSYRLFAKDEGFPKNRATYDVNNLYRYETLFQESPDAALAHFAEIPFLNGGLFECLDRTEDGTEKKRYLDGFSRNHKKRPHVPDRLFFDSGETANLSTAYGDTKRKAEKVTGLINILNRYKFTIVENTHIDQEIALDPELLGKVFENLTGFTKYLDGRDVCRYSIGWSGEYIKYGRNLAAPRNNFDLYSTPRILVRQIPNKPPYCIHACLISETVFNDRNSMNVINIAIKPQLVLAALNSRLISYWFIHRFGKMQRGIFPQFKINELAIFPIPHSFAPHEKSLIAAVGCILAAKQADPAADTSALEREIDQQVYALYNLTPEEIAIVEGTAK